MKTVRDYYVEHQLSKPAIQKYSQVDIRHTIETSTKDYFKFKKAGEAHLHMNVHLVLGYAASISALLSAYYSYQHDFSARLTQDAIIYGNAIYFLLYGLLMVFNYIYKQNIIYQGKDIEISMELKQFESQIKLQCKRKNGTNSIKIDVGVFFTTKGEFCGGVFYDALDDLITKKSK